MKKILIIGSGALKIGEAGEFDYSGSQALKAIKEEKIETILINPNIATVQTSEELSDNVYYLPITPFFVEKVIKKEKPDGILLSFGGQTALNCGVECEKLGIFDKYNVKVLGTPINSIIKTEDRQIFANLLKNINIKTPKSISAFNKQDALKYAIEIGFPIIIRSAYTLGGQGSGFCNNIKDLEEKIDISFSYSEQVLIEESLKGWKEVEYEVMRDEDGNKMIICNMENFDPLGIHTGESIVVAPSQTLTNSEYYKLRDISLKIVEEVGIIGECNVQFALDPNSEDYRVIEVNARLSRSSALASKATGYPIAFIAAKLSLGYKIHELKNNITKETSAFFEPSLDYVVCKLPRWDLNKFKGASYEIGSSMKSVGEVMSIGKTFEESIQKGLRMIGSGMHGFVGNKEIIQEIDLNKELKNPTDIRIFHIESAFKNNFTVEQIHEMTKIDKWFLYKLKNIFDISKELEELNKIEDLKYDLLLKSKKNGFSDFQISKLILKDNFDHNKDTILLRNFRKSIKILPYVNQIDTVSAEYPAMTNYLYLTYNSDSHDITFNNDKSIIVLGSGAYRIGSSVEFDWCSVSALNTIKKYDYKSIIINFNPETVSTDYDNSDKLYFDELTLERVLDIYELENPEGIIVSVGGQIPNNLALKLYNNGVNILGTSPNDIDNAENRHKFSKILDNINVDQPEWQELSTIDDVYNFVNKVDYPVLIRPSYVLSGSAMNIVSNKNELNKYLKLATKISKDYPVIVSKFITEAKEIEFDGVSKNGEVILYAISEHVEFAGVHSGDATLVFPPQKIYIETIRRIKKISKKISKELNITGPFNIQFLAKDNDIKVIECNLRSSRSFPFVSKILKTNFIEYSIKSILNKEIDKPNKNIFDLDYVGVKASQFSFSRISNSDPITGVEMVSTGEVGCIGEDFYEALIKSMLSVGYKIPNKGVLISSGNTKNKTELLEPCRIMYNKGLKIYATKGTHEFLNLHNIPSIKVNWADIKEYPNAIDIIKEKKVDLVINIPKNLTHGELYNDFNIRRSSIDFNIPLITNDKLASSFIYAIDKYSLEDLKILSTKNY